MKEEERPPREEAQKKPLASTRESVDGHTKWTPPTWVHAVIVAFFRTAFWFAGGWDLSWARVVMHIVWFAILYTAWSYDIAPWLAWSALALLIALVGRFLIRFKGWRRDWGLAVLLLVSLAGVGVGYYYSIIPWIVDKLFTLAVFWFGAVLVADAYVICIRVLVALLRKLFGRHYPMTWLNRQPFSTLVFLAVLSPGAWWAWKESAVIGQHEAIAGWFFVFLPISWGLYALLLGVLTGELGQTKNITEPEKSIARQRSR